MEQDVCRSNIPRARALEIDGKGPLMRRKERAARIRARRREATKVVVSLS